LIEDIAGLLTRKEAATGLPLVDVFRGMMDGAHAYEQRQLYGDRRARTSRQIIVRTIEEYASSTGNRQLLRLLARFRGDEQEARPTEKKVAAPVLPEKERDFASILSVLDRLGRPAGSADLGKYRRRWLEYAPRDPAPGYRNRLEEVLANMLRDGVIVARPTKQGAFQYSPGPNAGAYRKGETRQ